MKRIITLLLVFLLGSCASKQKTYEFNQNTKFDSINYRSEKLIIPALKDTVYIINPCDSLGVLKPFRETYSTPQGKIILEGKNNAITARIDLKEVEQSKVIDSRIERENNIQVKTEYKKVVVQDWRLILLVVMSVLLNIYLILSNTRKKV
ncbi:MAG: hypothetical protein DI539_16130 [Flavobacterium psychrophilum]|nr:MAG: hypothetical protein DI539_16130 [Flavobacterium psychrophilum]